MTKKEKIKVVEKLTTILSHNNTIYFTDTSNIDSNKVIDLRKRCYQSKIEVNVVKNNLLKIAMNSLSNKNFNSFYKVLKGNNSLLTTNIGGKYPAIIIKEHRSKYRYKRPIIKAVYNDNIFYLGDKIDTYINIKSKNELIGDIINMLKSNFINLLCNLKINSSKILFIIQIILKLKNKS